VGVLSYADDITLAVVSDTVGAAQQIMQRYLDSLEIWLKRWQFTINPLESSLQLFAKT
jgi:hypothetical protein